MRQRPTVHPVILVLIGALAALFSLSACEAGIPAPPVVTVVITAVDDAQALEGAVAQAMAATEAVNIGLTETVFAQGGVTLTPSNTPTASYTPTITPTRRVTSTPTASPTSTPSATFAAALTNTPAALLAPDNGWLRVVNAWQTSEDALFATAFDVYINDSLTAQALTYRNVTNYLQVRPGAVRISLRDINAPAAGDGAAPPIISSVVNIPASGIVTVLALNLEDGLQLVPIVEDGSPIPQGSSRVTLVQANPILPVVDVRAPSRRVTFAERLAVGSVVGPFEINAGRYTLDFTDAIDPSQTVLTLDLSLNSYASNLLILQAGSDADPGLTSIFTVPGFTRTLADDLRVSFVNAAPPLGEAAISLNQELVVEGLRLGDVSAPVPVPLLGAAMAVSAGETITSVLQSTLGPFGEASDRSDRIVLFIENPDRAAPERVVPVIFAQNAPASTINANIRVIHALPGAVPVSLQMRPLALPGEVPQAWVTLGEAAFSIASSYNRRTPDLYEIRVLQSGSSIVLAEAEPQQLLAGGTYDVILLPGAVTGSAELRVLQPTVQLTNLFTGEGNATAVFEAVGATLTAIAPVATATPTRALSPTPTRTPVPTNTPRPTNTPEFPPPTLLVNPAPPQTALDNVTVLGQNFVPDRPYAVTLDNQAEIISSGRTQLDGSLLATIALPSNLRPGPYTLRVCVDCRIGGAQQASYVVFLVADPRVTPTATAQP